MDLTSSFHVFLKDFEICEIVASFSKLWAASLKVLAKSLIKKGVSAENPE